MDKEGILSLPNPCAEKVFFLKSRKHKLKEELAGQARERKERKESVCTWTSETSRVSSSQDGQESISDDEDEDEDEDDDISASVDDSGSVGKIYCSPAGSTVTKDQVALKYLFKLA